jgi:hypothetical protein
MDPVAASSRDLDSDARTDQTDDEMPVGAADDDTAAAVVLTGYVSVDVS